MKTSHSILVAPYAFKGTLTSIEAAEAVAAALMQLQPDLRIIQLPLGDGGSGTLDALVGGSGGEVVVSRSTHADGATKESRWGMLSDGRGVIEAAESIALSGVSADKRHPELLTTAGLGELILNASEMKVTSLLIGLGDTATHDCGLGMASKLGYRFLDDTGEEIEPVGAMLPRLAQIDSSRVHTSLAALDCTVLCDVMNPLLGPDGAALRFASQKGAEPRTVALLEEGSRRFAEVCLRDLGIEVAGLPGAGAAGGLGAGLAAFLGGRLVSGAERVLDVVGFDNKLQECSTVITGEGRVDRKTLLGKGVSQIASRAASAGLRCLIVTGGVEGDLHELEDQLGTTIIVLNESGEDRDSALQAINSTLTTFSGMIE
jgi:glycerate kinase